MIVPSFWVRSFWNVLYYFFGKPYGVFQRLRCGLRGHAWYQCTDECCDGEWLCWRCLAPRPEAHA